MKKKLEKIMYMGIGAAIALISFSLGNMHRDTANAQGEGPILDRIRCRQLEIVNPVGDKAVVLGTYEDGGVVRVLGKDGGEIVLSIDGNGGSVIVNGKDGNLGVALGIREDGGSVGVGKDGNLGVVLGIREDGGSVAIFNKGGKIVGTLRGHDGGGGVLQTMDKHGYRTGSVP